jgi:hypothetical protein
MLEREWIVDARPEDWLEKLLEKLLENRFEVSHFEAQPGIRLEDQANLPLEI